jgi:hypothetical protein
MFLQTALRSIHSGSGRTMGIFSNGAFVEKARNGRDDLAGTTTTGTQAAVEYGCSQNPVEERMGRLGVRKG